MFDYIEKLRAKKPHEKQMIALGTAVVITGIIGLGWLATLPYRFANVQAPAPDANSVSEFQTARNGFTEMWARTSGDYQAIKSGIQASWSQAK